MPAKGVAPPTGCHRCSIARRGGAERADDAGRGAAQREIDSPRGCPVTACGPSCARHTPERRWWPRAPDPPHGWRPGQLANPARCGERTPRTLPPRRPSQHSRPIRPATGRVTRQEALSCCLLAVGSEFLSHPTRMLPR